VDDTTVLKKGRCSVGVTYQYSGAVGKMTNWQALVSLTVACQEVPNLHCLALIPAPRVDGRWRALCKGGRAAGTEAASTTGQIAIERAGVGESPARLLRS
jgi:hypothetical protein